MSKLNYISSPRLHDAISNFWFMAVAQHSILFEFGLRFFYFFFYVHLIFFCITLLTSRMPIIDKFKDMGTVVMGKIESGSTREGDSLLVMPNKVFFLSFCVVKFILLIFLGVA